MFRKLALLLAFVASAAWSGGNVAEAMIADSPMPARDHFTQIAPLEHVQWVWGGARYCWFDNGWRGPGFYQCGNQWTVGIGWGGGWGWNSWGGGWNNGWNGRGWHHGMRPPHRPGHRPPGHRPPGHRPPGHRPPGNRPPGHRPPGHGGNRPGHGGGNRPGHGGGGRPPGHGGGGHRPGGGGGGHRPGGGGGGHRPGGGGGGHRGGGGGNRRSSDIRVKHDIALLGRLDDGLGYYRFVYNGGHTAFVGVMAQEVQGVMPQAVTRGPNGYLRVSYDLLGVPFETYDQWVSNGAHLPKPNPAP